MAGCRPPSQVVGDELVPAGQCSWRAAAAPIPLPWPAEEQELVQQQEELWLQEREWLEDVEEEEDATEDGGGEEAVAGAGSAATADAEGREPAAKAPPRVVAIHKGEGQVAGPGFDSPEWVSGRLLAFADGALAFVWRDGFDTVTEMRRLRLPQ